MTRSALVPIPSWQAGGDVVLLTTEEAAKLLAVKPRWLELRRHQTGDGPPFIRISSRQIRYEREAVLRWLAGRTHVHTAQYADRDGGDCDGGDR